MKHLLRSITSITLSLSILVFSGGLAFTKMVCLASCHEEVSLGVKDDCCESKERSGDCVEKNCCEKNVEVFATDHFIKSENNPLPIASCLLPTEKKAYSVPVLRGALILDNSLSHPPPPGGRSLLHSIHQLTV